ncbi:hypothetical protein GCM10018783_45810 [Streptomyces griseosporeus]|nr:hypothetical protein GCM10018783_45810 [Streptomyces griseosporeus]
MAGMPLRMPAGEPSAGRQPVHREQPRQQPEHTDDPPPPHTRLQISRLGSVHAAMLGGPPANRFAEASVSGRRRSHDHGSVTFPGSRQPHSIFTSRTHAMYKHLLGDT